jgi:parvulin-like peptidyl-prolyl isomerase
MQSCVWTTSTVIILACCLLSPLPLGAQLQKKERSRQIASVDGVAITESQVRESSSEELDSLELKRLKEKAAFAQNEHEILENALERIVEEKLLAAEAAKQGISREELTAREIDGKVPQTTSEEIDRFYETNKQRIRME